MSVTPRIWLTIQKMFWQQFGLLICFAFDWNAHRVIRSFIWFSFGETPGSSRGSGNVAYRLSTEILFQRRTRWLTYFTAVSAYGLHLRPTFSVSVWEWQWTMIIWGSFLCHKQISGTDGSWRVLRSHDLFPVFCHLCTIKREWAKVKFILTTECCHLVLFYPNIFGCRLPLVLWQRVGQKRAPQTVANAFGGDTPTRMIKHENNHNKSNGWTMDWNEADYSV